MTKKLDELIAARRAVVEGIRLVPTRLHTFDDVGARDGASRGAAEIDRVRHHQNIARAHVARKAIDEEVLHQPQRSKTVRLKHQQQPPGKRM